MTNQKKHPVYIIMKHLANTYPRLQAPGFGGLGLGGLVPSFTVISSPVTRDTVVTETLTEEFKINFRNQVNTILTS